MSGASAAEACDSSVTCYIDEVPPFIGQELERLYQTLHSSLHFFATFRSLERVSCYVARRHGEAVCILLFTRRGRRIDVLNEMIEVPGPELERFASHVFSVFPRADIISFRAVSSPGEGFAFPLQRYASKQTWVVGLPATGAEYTSRIGKATRATILNRGNAVRRTFPSYRFDTYTGADIDEAHLREIMRLSEARINAGGAVLVHDAARITALARECGFVTVLSIQGRLRAGSINYRVGSNFFGEVIAYDPGYEKYSLGKLCAYQTICESIAAGGNRFFLGGGVFDFKRSLLGQLVSMDELTIYRSRWKMLLNLQRAAAAMLAARLRLAKALLHRHRQSMPARLVFACYYRLRRGSAR